MKMVLSVMAALALVAALEAGDVRNLGMGRLSLLAESELNRLDLFDFGHNPAGLLRSAPVSFSTGEDEHTGYTGSEEGMLDDYSYVEFFATGFGTTGQGKAFRQWAFGQPVPNELTEYMPVPLSAFGARFVPYPSRPLGGYWRSRASNVATAFSGAWSHGEEQGYLWLNTPRADFTRSGSFGELDYGIEASAFYMSAGSHYGDAQFLGPGVGVGIAGPSETFTWGLDARYYHPFFNMTSPTVKINGNSLAGGGELLMRPAEPIKVGARAGVKWTVVDELQFMSPYAALRMSYVQPEGPFVAGAEAEWSDVKTSYPAFWYYEHSDSLGLAGGIGLNNPDWFAGLEAHYSRLGLNPLDSTAGNSLALQAGVEINLGSTLVRAGYGRSAPGNDYFSKHMHTTWITAGVGLNFSGMTIDIAYNLVNRATPVGEHLLYLVVRSDRSGAGGMWFVE